MIERLQQKLLCTNNNTDIRMAIASLGYVGFKVSDVAAWSTFATDILGLMPGKSPSGAQRFRADLMEWRIALEQGDENDIAFAGFEVGGSADLDVIAARLRNAGVEVSPATPELLKERGVLGLLRCSDPAGACNRAFLRSDCTARKAVRVSSRRIGVPDR